MRRSRLLLGVTLALSLTQCGGPTTPPINSTSGSAQAPLPTVAPPPASFPEHETAVADAPAALAATWSSYSLTVIPSKHIFDAMPAPPRVANRSRGAVPDATAQQWAIAFNREGVLEQWADAKGQYAFRLRLISKGVNVGPEAQALQQGQTVDAPACFFFYPSMTLLPMDPTLLKHFASISQPTTAKYVFKVTAADTPCSVTAKGAGGAPRVIDQIPARTIALFAGEVVADPVLGPYWTSDAATACPIPGADPSLCAPD